MNKGGLRLLDMPEDMSLFKGTLILTAECSRSMNAGGFAYCPSAVNITFWAGPGSSTGNARAYLLKLLGGCGSSLPDLMEGMKAVVERYDDPAACHADDGRREILTVTVGLAPSDGVMKVVLLFIKFCMANGNGRTAKKFGLFAGSALDNGCDRLRLMREIYREFKKKQEEIRVQKDEVKKEMQEKGIEESEIDAKITAMDDDVYMTSVDPSERDEFRAYRLRLISC
ncbi:MAG TPA: hypothetical protein VF370_00385 [Candidatus Cryosericum sp.]